MAFDAASVYLMTLEQIERGLLSDPFNSMLRLQYAAALLDAAQSEASLTQYELLSRQTPADAAARAGQARALLALGRDGEALQQYEAARGLAGFEPVAEFEVLAARTRRAQPTRFIVVEGGVGAKVTALPVPVRERIRFDDVAGLDDLKRTIRLQIIEPFLRPGLFEKFRKKAGGGVLLYGPPGCGKTMVAKAVASECNAEFLSVGISDVLNMYIGESERNLAVIFDKARHHRPCVLFFDEIDALAFSRSKANSEHTRQVVNEFLSQLDGFGTDNQSVLILAATNMPWDVDPAMKRPGRFSRQVFVPPPDPAARAHLVELKLRGVPSEGIDAAAIAAITSHYSGADLEGVVELAKDFVLEEHVTNGADRAIQQRDLVRAAEGMQASTLDWLRTARNLVKYAGADDSYRDVDRYLKQHKLV
jgi:ATP-dependent 26S proteasome regulatory subunit